MSPESKMEERPVVLLSIHFEEDVGTVLFGQDGSDIDFVVSERKNGAELTKKTWLEHLYAKPWPRPVLLEGFFFSS